MRCHAVARGHELAFVDGAVDRAFSKCHGAARSRTLIFCRAPVCDVSGR